MPCGELEPPLMRIEPSAAQIGGMTLAQARGNRSEVLLPLGITSIHSIASYLGRKREL